MKVYIIDTGRLYNDINLTFAHTVHGTRQNRNPDIQWYTNPSYAVLIDHPDAGWILYDTGTSPDVNELVPESIGNDWYREGTAEMTMEYQLGLLHLKPSDIRHVILSHMHLDHIGNIRLFRDTAEFYVSRAEAANAFLTVSASPDPNRHGFYYKPDVLAELKELHYLEEDEELFPGVTTLLLPGHTPGTTGLLLRLKKQYSAELWFGHDLDQFNSWKKIPDFYC